MKTKEKNYIIYSAIFVGVILLVGIIVGGAIWFQQRNKNDALDLYPQAFDISRIENNIPKLKVGDTINLYVKDINKENALFNKPLVENLKISQIADENLNDTDISNAKYLTLLVDENFSKLLIYLENTKINQGTEYQYNFKIEKSNTKNEMKINKELQNYFNNMLIMQ